MLGENIKNLRKQKGISQEVLAQQLSVVRQTVSKWEKGLSVPDADMLTRIADYFGVSVSALLGDKIEKEVDTNEIASQLAVLNEHLAARARKAAAIRKGILIAIAVFFGLWLVIALLGVLPGDKSVTYGSPEMTATVTCTFDGETHQCRLDCDGNRRTVSSEWDEWFDEQVPEVGDNEVVDVLIHKIEDRVEELGGTVQVEWDSYQPEL